MLSDTGVIVRAEIVFLAKLSVEVGTIIEVEVSRHGAQGFSEGIVVLVPLAVHPLTFFLD